MNPFDTDILAARLHAVDQASMVAVAAPPAAATLIQRGRTRQRRRRSLVAASAVSLVLCCSLLLSSRRSDVPNSTQLLASIEANLALVDQRIAALANPQPIRGAQVSELAILLAALDLQESRQRQAELAKLEATVRPAVDASLIEAESAALRLAIAAQYEEHHEVDLAITGYQQLIASQPNTPWAAQASERLAVLQR